MRHLRSDNHPKHRDFYATLRYLTESAPRNPMITTARPRDWRKVTRCVTFVSRDSRHPLSPPLPSALLTNNAAPVATAVQATGLRPADATTPTAPTPINAAGVAFKTGVRGPLPLPLLSLMITPYLPVGTASVVRSPCAGWPRRPTRTRYQIPARLSLTIAVSVCFRPASTRTVERIRPFRVKRLAAF